MSLPKDYKNAIGIWSVTTESDEEGRTTKHLGVWAGNIADIALHLANKVFYSLRFTAVSPNRGVLPPTEESVSISLDIDSNTWKLSGKELVSAIKNMQNFPSDLVQVGEGKAYASVTLRLPKNMAKHIRENRLLQSIKGKLTKEEWELLNKVE